MSRVRNQSAKGFTLIELMLSMSFVSILLLLIMMTVMQIMNVYNKGISMREVNQTGRAIALDLQRTIATSSPFEIDAGINNRYVTQAGGGRLCVGQFSYLWNYGNAGTPPNTYEDGEAVRLVKVVDADAQYCTTPSKKVPVAQRSQVVDLLKSGDRNLAIHDFMISRASTANDPATEQALYSIQFIVGTNTQAALTTSNTKCAPPSESEGEENYCAVNKFDIVVRSGNEAPIK